MIKKVCFWKSTKKGLYCMQNLGRLFDVILVHRFQMMTYLIRGISGKKQYCTSVYNTLYIK